MILCDRCNVKKSKNDEIEVYVTNYNVIVSSEFVTSSIPLMTIELCNRCAEILRGYIKDFLKCTKVVI